MVGGRDAGSIASPCELKGARSQARGAPEPSIPVQRRCDPQHATKASQHLMSHQPPPRIVGCGNYRAVPVRRTEYSTTRFRCPCGARGGREAAASCGPAKDAMAEGIHTTASMLWTVAVSKRTLRSCSDFHALGDGGRMGPPDRCSGASHTSSAIRLPPSAAWFHQDAGPLPRERVRRWPQLPPR